MATLISCIVFAGILWLVLRPRASRRPVRPETPKVPSGDKEPNIESARFDPKSARHLEPARILTGAAYITDGDTIKIKHTQIRLFGIDAPELDHPYGQKAKWALHKLCKGHRIRAEITETDKFGRTVARCYLPDGRDLSAEMVKLGLAIDWPKFSGGKYGPLEVRDVRKRLFLADARQKGRMHVWERYETRQSRS